MIDPSGEVSILPQLLDHPDIEFAVTEVKVLKG